MFLGVGGGDGGGVGGGDATYYIIMLHGVGSWRAHVQLNVTVWSQPSESNVAHYHYHSCQGQPHYHGVLG